MNIYRFIIFFYFLGITYPSQAQIRIALLKTDCAENFKPSFCEEAYQAVHRQLDSLQQYLAYEYVSYNHKLSKQNLILTYVTFKPHKLTKDTCLQLEFKDAWTNEYTTSGGPFSTCPVKFNQENIDKGPLGGYLLTMHRSITGLSPSWLEVTPQTYFEKPSLFFEFDKIHFEVELSKKIQKEIYLISHNILAQEQIWERKFNFRSKYTNQKVKKTEDTKLYIAFEDHTADDSTFMVTIYLQGTRIIDIMPYTNEKINTKIFVNKERIKNRDYTELIDKLSLIYLWVIINSDA